MSEGIYLKLDFPRETLSLIPDLKSLGDREAAYRVSLVIWVDVKLAESKLSIATGVTIGAESNWLAVKAPTLEGTEIWLMEPADQAGIEHAAGFGKASLPLLSLRASDLNGKIVSLPTEPKRTDLLLKAVSGADGPQLIFSDETNLHLAGVGALGALQESGNFLGEVSARGVGK